jgi:ATP-dependent Clp protease ATP-binding subunit ClpC
MNFTPRAERALHSAKVEARSLGHPCVGSQHLVLGLFLLGSGVHFSVLQELGFSADSLRRSIMAAGPVAEQTQGVGGFLFGSSAAHALERASQQAAAMSHTYTGTEHILLGLLSEESGGAADLFAAHKVDVVKTRQRIVDECTQV